MYEDLVNLARYCAEKDACINCPVGGCQGTTGIMNHLADAIEELQQTVKHYKGCSDDWYKEACDYKAMLPRWIPVTERLPKNYTDVLIYYERNAWPDGADYPVRKREIGIGFCGGPDRWHVDHCSGVDGLAWMPLPEPPKEEA